MRRKINNNFFYNFAMEKIIVHLSMTQRKKSAKRVILDEIR